jgi:hypothetical protein
VTTAETARLRNPENLLLWAAQIVLAAVFVFAAAGKLAGGHTAVQMFGQIGAGQWLRYFAGGAELAGAIGLLIRPPTALAAAGLAAGQAAARPRHRGARRHPHRADLRAPQAARRQGLPVRGHAPDLPVPLDDE